MPNESRYMASRVVGIVALVADFMIKDYSYTSQGKVRQE